MPQYYFTVASLPLLTLDSDTALTPDEFLAVCGRELTPRDYERIVAARRAYDLVHHGEEAAGSPSQLRTVFQYLRAERSLRVELARLRAPQVGWGAEKTEAVPADAASAQIARDAMNQDSPLAAEAVLDRARWRRLDDLEIGHYFDIEKLAVYLYRLLLLRRRAKIGEERGREQFQRTYDALVENQIREKSETADDER